jgi:hypothetical protein
VRSQEAAWLEDPDATPFPGPLAAQRRLLERAERPLRGVTLSTSERLLLVALVLRVDSRTGETSPRWSVSVAALGRATGLSARGVRLALSHLQAAGVVVVIPRQRGGQQLTNTYAVTVPHPDNEGWWSTDPKGEETCRRS